MQVLFLNHCYHIFFVIDVQTKPAQILSRSLISLLFLYTDLLYFYYMVGQALEYMWGAFRFNLYFFSGVLLHVLACLVIYLIFGINFSMGTFYLNLSLFFVYAYLFPDATFLLFFIFVNMKIKYFNSFYNCLSFRYYFPLFLFRFLSNLSNIVSDFFSIS